MLENVVKLSEFLCTPKTSAIQKLSIIIIVCFHRHSQGWGWRWRMLWCCWTESKVAPIAWRLKVLTCTGVSHGKWSVMSGVRVLCWWNFVKPHSELRCGLHWLSLLMCGVRFLCWWIFVKSHSELWHVLCWLSVIIDVCDVLCQAHVKSHPELWHVLYWLFQCLSSLIMWYVVLSCCASGLL